MSISRVTSIGRPVDLRYPTNLVIFILSMGVAAGGILYRLLAHELLLQSGKWGLKAGFTVFLAWAICRELDPDNDVAAFVGAGLTVFGVLLWGFPSFLVLFWLLLIIRVVNRTAGLAAKTMDSLAVVILGGALVFQGHWGLGLVTALALFLDSRLPIPHKRQIVFAGLVVLSTVLIVVLKQGYWTKGELYWSMGGLALGLSAVFVPVMFNSRALKSIGDVTGEPLSPARIMAGQGLALLSGIQVALWSGAEGLLSLLPLWAAIVGAAVFMYITTLKKFLTRV